MSVNKVILIGNLGKNPEMKTFDNGSSVSNFTLATSRNYKDKQGNKVEDTEWHRIVAFGRIAEICNQYLSKGSQIYIEGRLKTREWKDKEETRHWTTEVITERMRMLGNRSDNRNDSVSADKVTDNAVETDVPF